MALEDAHDTDSGQGYYSCKGLQPPPKTFEDNLHEAPAEGFLPMPDRALKAEVVAGAWG